MGGAAGPLGPGHPAGRVAGLPADHTGPADQKFKDQTAGAAWIVRFTGYEYLIRLPTPALVVLARAFDCGAGPARAAPPDSIPFLGLPGAADRPALGHHPGPFRHPAALASRYPDG